MSPPNMPQVGQSPQGSGTAAQPSPGQIPTAPFLPEIPTGLEAFTDYQIEKLLGEGGMGKVYLALNKPLDRREVLKVVQSDLLSRPGILERFQQEIRNAARLKHTNIVTAYACLQNAGQLAFAMEYVPGDDLAQLVADEGPLPVQHAAHYVRQVALGLQHAHEHGMIHRDIKPQNLIVARDGNRHLVKILDFGLSKVRTGQNVDAALTGANRMIGTPDYISPEQIHDAAKADIRSDIYSLGCTLYFLLSGERPFRGQSLYEVLESHVSKEPRELMVLRPDVPAELAAVVKKMMAKSPAHRFQVPAEVAVALMPFVKGKASKVPKRPRPQGDGGTAEQSQLSTVETRERKTPPPLPPVATRPSPAGTMAGEAWWQTMAPNESRPKTPPSVGTLVEKPAGDSNQPGPKTRTERLARPRSFARLGIAIGLASVVILAVSLAAINTGKPQQANPASSNQGEVTDDLSTALRTPVADVDVLVTGGTSSTSEPMPTVVPQPRSDRMARSYGDWKIDGDELVQTDHGRDARLLLFGNDSWTNYDVEATMKGGSGSPQLLYRVVDRERWSTAFLRAHSAPDGRGLIHIESNDPTDGGGQWEHIKSGQRYELYEKPVSPTKLNEWHTVRLSIRGNRATVTLNGEDPYRYSRVRHPSGCIGLRTWNGEARFKDIKVTDPDGKVLWEGLPELPKP